MVEVSDIYKSDWVNVTLVKDMKQRKAVIINEGTIEKGYTEDKQVLMLSVELNGDQYNWSVNKTSFYTISEVWGTDSKAWVGKTVQFTITKINGKESLVAIPLDDVLK